MPFLEAATVDGAGPPGQSPRLTGRCVEELHPGVPYVGSGGVLANSNGRRVTMRDVARTADVPVSAVALVLNGRPGVSEERRELVLRTAQSLGYSPREVQRTTVVGLVIEDLSREARLDGLIDTMVQGVYTEARRRGVRVALTVYHERADPFEDLRALTGRAPDGILLTNGGDITADVIARVMESTTPVVLIENHVDLPVSAVVTDSFEAGLTATRHLLGLGHTRIGLVRGSRRYVSLTDRARGHLAALWEAGIAPEAELMPEQPAGSALKGYAQTLALLDLPSPPTAIYAVSDKSALGAYQAVAERGLRIGIDVSVVGTDNVEESAFRTPPLTTFDVRAREIGQQALRSLLRIVDGETAVTRTVVRGELVERSSTGPVAQSAIAKKVSTADGRRRVRATR